MPFMPGVLICNRGINWIFSKSPFSGLKICDYKVYFTHLTKSCENEQHCSKHLILMRINAKFNPLGETGR